MLRPPGIDRDRAKVIGLVRATRIVQPVIPPSAKGFPAEAVGLSVDEVSDRRFILQESFTTPIAVLDLGALDHNLKRMATWCREHNVELWPHGKTTMSPELFSRQLVAGAAGITAATMTQVRAMRAAGVGRVLLANEVVQTADAEWAARELAGDSGFELLSLVDSTESVRVLEAAGAASGITFQVLLEIGSPGGRTGCRTRDQREWVVKEVASSPHVSLVGVEGYEGILGSGRDQSTVVQVRGFLAAIRDIGAELVDRGVIDEPVILSAGGSVYFDLVAEELGRGSPPGKARALLRSGCYVSHDSGAYEARSPLAGSVVADPLRAALTVWSSILSRPEQGRALLDAGRRDVSFDNGLPVVLRRRPRQSDVSVSATRMDVARLSDQHGWLDLPWDVELDPGDRLELGISHPCTTFDKWRFIPVVDSGGTVVDVITTWF